MLVGAAQIDISIGDKSANLRKCVHLIETAGRQRIEMVVFPECTLTGYIFDGLDEAFRVSETVPGNSTGVLQDTCRKHKVTAVVGLLERQDERLYNTAVLVNPEGNVGVYRKTHLPYLGVDRFVSRGRELPLFNLSQARVGILICYDLRFPEPARVMALNGAQVICNPTNLPKNIDMYANFFNRSRACENWLFVVSANRVGRERDFQFIGRSQIVGRSGQILAEAIDASEQIIKAEIRPEEADAKHVVNIPGEFETNIFEDRRPELYKRITDVSLR